jgi:predicted permease
MAEEMRFHLEERAAAYARQGLDDRDAKDAARRRFGNLAELQELARDARGWRRAEFLMKDLRFAARQLARSPGFALLAILTLALGIGVNTAMFNVLQTIRVRPLPYADPGRLDAVYRATPQNRDGGFSPADFLELSRAADGRGTFAAYSVANASLSEPGRPAEIAEAARATPNLLSLLGVTPQLGRDFLPDEGAPGRDRVVILSQRTWRRRFQSSFDVVGRTIRVDGEPHQIVGVLPESFNDWRHLGAIDFFRPLALDDAQKAERASTSLDVIARRPPGRTRTELDAFAAGVGARVAKTHPDVSGAATWRAVPLRDSTIGKDAAPILSLLVGLSGFVVLIACSNLANFLLARTMARAREFALRAALGASKTQLLRPLVAESLIISILGGALALAVAYGFGQYLTLRSTGDNGEAVTFFFDWPIFCWALGASLVTAVAFGVAPALFATRLDLNATLKSGGRGSTGGKGHQRFRRALIVGQFALAMVLLTAAGLMIRGLEDLNNRRAGFDSSRLAGATYLLPAGAYKTPEEIAAFQRRVVSRLEAIPGVSSASVAASTPFWVWSDSRKFVADGRQRPERGREPAARVNAVSPRYFETVGTPLLAGRAFAERDTSGAPRVAVVSRTFAEKLFGTSDAVGRRLVEVATGQLAEIVGVAADVQSVSPDVSPLTFQVYVPMAQDPRRQNEIAVRAADGAPSALLPAIRAVMSDLDPDLPLRKVMTADARIYRFNYQTRVLRDMLASFAMLGLALASVGIYGVIARLMAQRTSEFAIRVALGATVADIRRMVLRSGVSQALTGAAIGLAGAIGVSKLIAATNPGMRFESPAILLGTTLILVAVALLACWMPARRAAKLDATLALRAE